jgi:hypothetical protein
LIAYALARFEPVLSCSDSEKRASAERVRDAFASLRSDFTSVKAGEPIAALLAAATEFADRCPMEWLPS